MRQQDKGQLYRRLERLNCAQRRVGLAALVFALAALLLPVSGKSQVSSGPSSQEELRVLEESYSALKKEYATRTEELVETLDRLAESMARLGEMRDLAAAREGQLRSAESSRRQIESDFLALTVEYEERGALLSVAARDLDSCDVDRIALRQDLGRHTVAAKALETNVLSLEKKLADLEPASRQPLPDNGVKKDRVTKLENDLHVAEQKVNLLASLEKDLQDQRKSVTMQDEEIARLKKELAGAKGQVKEKQSTVASLKDEKENQTEITKKLVRKVRESTTRLMALQNQLTAVEKELNTLREKSAQ